MKDQEFYSVLNKYINFFLVSFGDENVQKKWKDKQSQENFKTFVFNSLNKIHQFKDMENIYKHNMKTKSKKVVESGPKKNLSAYLHFCKDERQVIYNENKSSEKTISNTNIVSEMASRWKALSESDPAKYQRYVDLANEDKQRYLTEKAEWKPTETVVEKEVEITAPVSSPVPESTKKAPKKRVSKKKEEVVEEVLVEEDVVVEEPVSVPVVEAPVPDTKKKGGNKYINFCNKMRETVKTEKPGITFKEVSVELGKRWKELSPEEQLKFA
jgi:hypothetical protein